MITDVVVVGGGIAGLGAALALAREGLSVVLIEARSAPRPDVFGMMVWPPGTRVLDWLGVRAALDEHGAVLEHTTWCGEEGSDWFSIALEKLGAFGRFVGILPSHVETALRHAALANGVTWAHGQLDSLRRHASVSELNVLTSDGPPALRARVVIGADGPQSRTRQLLGLRSWSTSAGRPLIFTAVGGKVPTRGLRQAMGRGWSASSVTLGHDESWLAVCHYPNQVGRDILDAYASADPSLLPAIAGIRRSATVKAETIVVPRWVTDGAVLVGDAAHAMLPQLGVGGSQALEDVPELVEIVTRALKAHDLSAERLAAFQKARAARTGYAQRASLAWALASTGAVTPMRKVRDFHLGRLQRRPEVMAKFLAEIAATGVPSWSSRASVWLP